MLDSRFYELLANLYPFSSEADFDCFIFKFIRNSLSLILV